MTATGQRQREARAAKTRPMLCLIVGIMALPLMLPSEATAQGLGLRSYSASGMHQCGNGEHAQSCVVTGLGYRDCIEAGSALRSQDCCLTRRDGTRSTGFTLSYCIPESGLGR